jgi:hypothetical protein
MPLFYRLLLKQVNFGFQWFVCEKYRTIDTSYILYSPQLTKHVPLVDHMIHKI